MEVPAPHARWSVSLSPGPGWPGARGRRRFEWIGEGWEGCRWRMGFPGPNAGISMKEGVSSTVSHWSGMQKILAG